MDCLVVLKAFSYGVTGMGCNSQKTSSLTWGLHSSMMAKYGG